MNVNHLSSRLGFGFFSCLAIHLASFPSVSIIGRAACRYYPGSTMLHFTNCALQLIIGGENLIPTITLIDFETFKIRPHFHIGRIVLYFYGFFHFDFFSALLFGALHIKTQCESSSKPLGIVGI